MNRYLVMAGLMLATEFANATDAAQGKTLDQFIERAAVSRLSLSIAATRVDAARAKVGQARAQRLPSVDLLGSLERIENFDTFTGITGTVNIPELNTSSTIAVTQNVPRYQVGAALQARYELYTGGRLRAQQDRSELALQAAEALQKTTLQDVAREVTHAYFKLRQACVRSESAARRLQAAQKTATLMQQRLEAGRIAEIEHSTSLLALAESRSESRVRLGELDDAVANLAAALHEGATAPSASDVSPCRFPASIDADLAAAARLADDRPLTQFYALQEAAARKDVDVERAALRPQVSVYAKYVGVGRSDASFRDAFSDSRRKQVILGVQLNYNLFDAGLMHRRVAERQAEANRLRLGRDLANAERVQAKRRATTRVVHQESRVELARARWTLAQSRARTAAARLQTATGSALVAEEQVALERDALDELQLAQLELALVKVTALFPTATPAEFGQ